MPRKGFCRICRFWETDGKFRPSDKRFFEKQCREARSLRQLKLLLESYGLRAGKDTVAKHIKNCMDVEIKQQRDFEKQIKKNRSLGREVKNFLLRTNDKDKKSKCLHSVTVSWFDIPSEKVWTRCKSCGAILGSSDP